MSETQSMTSPTAAPGDALASGGVRRHKGSMTDITWWSLRHKRLVIGFWLVLTLLGMAFAGRAAKTLSQGYSIPGRESYLANAAISRGFGSGGDGPPLVAVVTLPTGMRAGSPTVLAGLNKVSARIERAVPHARVASLATTGDHAFVSRDGRTTS